MMKCLYSCIKEKARVKLVPRWCQSDVSVPLMSLVFPLFLLLIRTENVLCLKERNNYNFTHYDFQICLFYFLFSSQISQMKHDKCLTFRYWMIRSRKCYFDKSQVTVSLHKSLVTVSLHTHWLDIQKGTSNFFHFH